eukprot:75421_1
MTRLMTVNATEASVEQETNASINPRKDESVILDALQIHLVNQTEDVMTRLMTVNATEASVEQETNASINPRLLDVQETKKSKYTSFVSMVTLMVLNSGTTPSNQEKKANIKFV